MNLQDEVWFPDGNSITLTNIEHQLCPCESISKWEGDLYLTLATSTENNTEDKIFFLSAIDQNRNIFTDHEISSLSYTYGSEYEDVPP